MRLEHADLQQLLRYALLKVPPLLREALAASDQDRRRTAEKLIADRIPGDMRHLEVTGSRDYRAWRCDPRQQALPLPITEADLLY